jgi:hypothetical protein
MLGIKFGPIPCRGCGPGAPPFKIGDAAGSTPNTLIAGLFTYNKRPVPVIVPPVPIPDTKASTLPSRSRQISGPVVL